MVLCRDTRYRGFGDIMSNYGVCEIIVGCRFAVYRGFGYLWSSQGVSHLCYSGLLCIKSLYMRRVVRE